MVHNNKKVWSRLKASVLPNIFVETVMHLFDLDLFLFILFCKTIDAFSVTCNQFKASLLNKSFLNKKKNSNPKLLNGVYNN